MEAQEAVRPITDKIAELKSQKYEIQQLCKKFSGRLKRFNVCFFSSLSA